MRRSPLDAETARFAREWNAALVLVLAAALLLLAGGHSLAGALAAGLAATAVAVRGRAMRRQGRGFYGEPRRPR